EGRARPDVVEAQGDHVTLAPERVLEPGGLLLPPEPGQTHPELDEPRAVDEPRRPPNPDPAGRRALTERAGLAGEGDEWRAAGDRLGLRPIAPRVDRACRERQPPFVCHLESARLDRAAYLGIGRAGHGLAVHFAGPQQIKILRERAAARRRHDE